MSTKTFIFICVILWAWLPSPQWQDSSEWLMVKRTFSSSANQWCKICSLVIGTAAMHPHWTQTMVLTSLWSMDSRPQQSVQDVGWHIHSHTLHFDGEGPEQLNDIWNWIPDWQHSPMVNWCLIGPSKDSTIKTGLMWQLFQPRYCSNMYTSSMMHYPHSRYSTTLTVCTSKGFHSSESMTMSTSLLGFVLSNPVQTVLDVLHIIFQDMNFTIQVT